MRLPIESCVVYPPPPPNTLEADSYVVLNGNHYNIHKTGAAAFSFTKGVKFSLIVFAPPVAAQGFSDSEKGGSYGALNHVMDMRALMNNVSNVAEGVRRNNRWLWEPPRERYMRNGSYIY
jgi:hypothetical protein